MVIQGWDHKLIASGLLELAPRDRYHNAMVSWLQIIPPQRIAHDPLKGGSLDLDLSAIRRSAFIALQPIVYLKDQGIQFLVIVQISGLSHRVLLGHRERQKRGFVLIPVGIGVMVRGQLLRMDPETIHPFGDHPSLL